MPDPPLSCAVSVTTTLARFQPAALAGGTAAGPRTASLPYPRAALPTAVHVHTLAHHSPRRRPVPYRSGTRPSERANTSEPGEVRLGHAESRRQKSRIAYYTCHRRTD